MNYYLSALCFAGFLIFVLWVVSSMTSAFGWRSPLKIVRRYKMSFNGSSHEILLVTWRRKIWSKEKNSFLWWWHKVVRTNEQLSQTVEGEGYSFAREEDMVTLLKECHLPPSYSIYSKRGENDVMAIDAFSSRNYHESRTSDTFGFSDYDLYAIVSNEFVSVGLVGHQKKKQLDQATV